MHSSTYLLKIRWIIDFGFILIIFIVALQTTSMMAEMISRGSEYGVKKGVYTHIDFIDIYSIGHLLRSSQRRELYSPATQLDFYNRTIAPDKVDQCFYDQTPPHYLLFVTPLSFLSFQNALFSWNTLSVFFAASAICLLRKANLKLKLWGMIVFIAAGLASLPGADCLMNGQTSWLFLPVFAIFLYAFIERKDVLGGLALTVITFKPHYFVLLIIPALIGRRVRLIIVAAIATLAVLVATAFVVGWQNVLYYPGLLLQAEGKNNFAGLFPEKMICMRGFFSLFLQRDIALRLSFAFYAIGLLATAWFWYLAIVKRTLDVQWAFALMILTMLITSPHLHLYDAILIILPAALTMPTVRFTEAIVLHNTKLRLWTLTLMSYPLLTWIFMLLVPPLGSLILPSAVQLALSTNGQSCGLLSFQCYLALNMFLLIVGFMYAMGDKKSSNVVVV